MFPQITRFFWGDIDLRWFPEACLSHPRGAKGFYTVQHFIEGQTMPGSGVLDIVEWRQNKLTGKAMNGTTPLEMADALAKNAAEALRGVAELRRSQGQNKELRLTLGDMEAMGHLGNYYAAKIRAATELALFDKPPRWNSANRRCATCNSRWITGSDTPTSTRCSTSSRSCTTAWAGWTFPG